jgi:molybdopterin converting factor small subunit
MTVCVKFSGHLRALLGKEEVRLDLPPDKFSSIKDILSEIERTEGRRISPIVTKANGDSREVLKIVHNGKVISARHGLETRVQNGDSLMIFPMIAGG